MLPSCGKVRFVRHVPSGLAVEQRDKGARDIPLRDMIAIGDLEDYRLHFAEWAGRAEPPDEIVRDRFFGLAGSATGRGTGLS